MDFLNKYKYPVVIVIAVVLLGWAYLYFMQEDESWTIANDELDEYVARLEAIDGLKLKTDIFESKVYLSLTDEFEEDVMEVRIGKINPFDPR